MFAQCDGVVGWGEPLLVQLPLLISDHLDEIYVWRSRSVVLYYLTVLLLGIHHEIRISSYFVVWVCVVCLIP